MGYLFGWRERFLDPRGQSARAHRAGMAEKPKRQPEKAACQHAQRQRQPEQTHLLLALFVTRIWEEPFAQTIEHNSGFMIQTAVEQQKT